MEIYYNLMIFISPFLGLWSIQFKKYTLRRATLLKRDSNTGTLLWILQIGSLFSIKMLDKSAIFSEHLQSKIKLWKYIVRSSTFPWDRLLIIFKRLIWLQLSKEDIRFINTDLGIWLIWWCWIHKWNFYVENGIFSGNDHFL